MKKKHECYGVDYSRHIACGVCLQFYPCGEEWAERSRHRIMHAHRYFDGTSVGDPSPAGENAIKEMEDKE